jgi:glycosyltransferase involved in cell wall biosynthesis
VRTNSPRVSIGLPVCNGEKYLRAALDSILGQTYADFELIISDNASSDATDAICREYAARDRRIRYYRNPTNVGAHWNYARVLDLARSEYFKWAAHDDICHPSFLARCIEVLDRDASVVLCHTKTQLIDEHGQPLSHSDVARGYFVNTSGDVIRIQGYDRPRQLDSARPSRRFCDILLETRWCFEIFGVIRRAVLVETSSFCDLYFYGADKVILAELSLRGRFAEIPDVLFFRRCHATQSATIDSSRKRVEWSNPSVTRRLVFPRLLCFRAYGRAAFRAPLSRYERARCFLALARLACRLDRWAGALASGYRAGRAALPARVGRLVTRGANTGPTP